MSFDRVTMSAGRLSELWYPDPYSRNQWMIPEVDVENKSMIVLHSWMYGSCGWMTFMEAAELRVLPTSLFAQCRYLFQSPCNARKLPPKLEGKVKMDHWSNLILGVSRLLQKVVQIHECSMMCTLIFFWHFYMLCALWYSSHDAPSSSSSSPPPSSLPPGYRNSPETIDFRLHASIFFVWVCRYLWFINVLRCQALAEGTRKA